MCVCTHCVHSIVTLVGQRNKRYWDSSECCVPRKSFYMPKFRQPLLTLKEFPSYRAASTRSHWELVPQTAAGLHSSQYIFLRHLYCRNLRKRLTDGVTNFNSCSPATSHNCTPKQCFASTVSVAGTKWKEHRKLFTPAFHFKILEDFVEVFSSNDRILIEKLEKHVNGPPFDIRPYISLCTLDIICGKHNVSLVTGAQHVLWHTIMIYLSGLLSALGQLRYFAGLKAVKVTCSLSTIQG